MTPSLVNQKTIDGVTYTAYRSVENGVCVETVTCNGKEAQVRLRDFWNDPAKLKTLFEAA